MVRLGLSLEGRRAGHLSLEGWRAGHLSLEGRRAGHLSLEGRRAGHLQKWILGFVGEHSWINYGIMRLVQVSLALVPFLI